MGFAGHTPKATHFKVSASTVSILLIAENHNRRGVTIHNDSTAVLYIKLGEEATTSEFTDILLDGDYYETPYGFSGPVYGIWSSATGQALLTEIA
jgi:hypothetical protein